MAVFTAAEALEMALEIEKNGEVFYNEAAAKSADPEVKALFEDLASQERGHYKIFQKMLGDVKPAPELPAAEYDQYQDYLQVALENALFAGPEKALSLARQAEDRETALRAAMGFEKDTLLFFYDLRDMVVEADRGAISNIIREEKKHLRRLARML
ncbi:MAG: ferritin family protein [Chloroflexota bacterium]|nr:ferritin family protein [Chloroflexota bacterium]